MIMWHFYDIFDSKFWQISWDGRASWRHKTDSIAARNFIYLKFETGPKQWRRPSSSGKRWPMQPVQVQDLVMDIGPLPSRILWWSLEVAMKESLTNYMSIIPVSFSREITEKGKIFLKWRIKLRIFCWFLLIIYFLLTFNFILTEFWAWQIKLNLKAFVCLFVCCWKWRWPRRHLGNWKGAAAAT